MTDTKHMPTPLRADDCVIYWNGKRVAIALEGDVGRGAAIYNAAHIVKCVNMHDELVEALKNLHIAALQSTVNSLSNDYGSDALSESYALLKKAGAL